MEKRSFTKKDLSFLDGAGLRNAEQMQDWLTEDVKNQIQLAEYFLDKLVIQYKFYPGSRLYKRYRTSSYGLKHTIERAFGTYISNTATIIACYNKGIKQTFIKERTDPMNTLMSFYIKKECLDQYNHFEYTFETRGSADEVLEQLDALKKLKESFKTWGN